MRPPCILALLALVLPASALAAPAIPSDPGDIVAGAVDAMRGGRWTVLLGFAGAAIVLVLRRFGRRLVPWFGTDRGGTVFTLLVGVLTALAAPLVAGRQLDAMTALDGVGLALEAAGGFLVVRQLLWPRDRRGAVGAVPERTDPGPGGA